MAKVIRAADLFCGAGGSSTGLAMVCKELSCRLDLTAVDHWPLAVETHAANHPAARHICETLDSVDPRKLFAADKLDLLIASPECTNHSRAKGGMPVNDQSRSTAWHVVRWADALRPRNILVENVPEFLRWGPIGSSGRPLRSKEGQTFYAWAGAIESLGYAVRWRVLNAADHGAATTRERLFVQAVRGRRSICWPEPTHARQTERDLFGGLPLWRGARDVIDWTSPGKLLSERARPLCDDTTRRIEMGTRSFPGQPFLTVYYGTGTADSVDRPLRTLTVKDRLGLVVPSPEGLRYRMLQPRELSAAMGFPPDYVFRGTQSEVVKQIGNAVEVNVAAAMCRTLLVS